MHKFVPLIFPFLLILLCTNCRSIKVRKLSCIDQVEKLKAGALLVRLKTSENKISKLIEYGRNSEAEKVKREQLEDNLNIIQAFKNHFEFCPVYFFLSGNSKQVRSGELGNIFVNENLEIDTTIQFTGEYLTADFSRTQGVPTKDENGTQVATTSSFGLPALVVMDKNFVQMSNPFPATVRVPMFRDAIIKDRAVQSLNNDLFYFYYEGRRWKAKKMLIDF